MLSRPTTEQILLDCRDELLSDDRSRGRRSGRAQIAIEMMENVLRNCAARAAHEIAWMREESEAILAFASGVAQLGRRRRRPSPLRSRRTRPARPTACTSTTWSPRTTSPASASKRRSTRRWPRATDAGTRRDARSSSSGSPTRCRSSASGRWSAVPDPCAPDRPIDLLVVTGGHPFEAEPFFAVFDSLPGVSVTRRDAPGGRPRRRRLLRHARHPLHAQHQPGRSADRARAPTDEQRHVIQQLCADGVGLVFLHHADRRRGPHGRRTRISSVGASTTRRRRSPASTTPTPAIASTCTHTVEVLDPTHPVCAGLGSSLHLDRRALLLPGADTTRSSR